LNEFFLTTVIRSLERGSGRVSLLCYVMFITPGGTKPKGPYTALPNQYIHLKHN
jgi:hypothetical protein